MRRHHPALKGGVRLWLALAGVLAAWAVSGDVITWTNAAGGDFSTAGNWSPNTVPGNLDTTVFNVVTSPYTVTWTNNYITNHIIQFQRGTSVFNLQGNTWVYSCTNKVSYAGQSTNPVDLTITNGGMRQSGSYSQIGKQDFWVYGTGTMVRLMNATLAAGYNVIGPGATVVVDGTGSVWKAGSYCSIYARGLLVVTNGGLADYGNSLTLWGSLRIEGTNSRCKMSTSLLNVIGTAFVADGGLLTTAQKMAIDSNGVFTVRDAAVSSPSITNAGVFEGSGVVTGAFRNIGGVVAPGGSNGVGTLSFVGNYYNNSPDGITNGTMAFELGGIASNQYDRVAVDGTLNATGTVTVALIDGFQPQHGDRFRIFQFTSVAGVFDAVNLPGDVAHWNLRDLYVTGEIHYLCPGSIISFY